jgi:hypothetical protein
MKRFLLQIATALMISFFFASPLFAQASRTWVSGVGDDANPCSRTAPCKTFAGAISKTAARGEIDVLDPGGFGAVTITKAITIDGTAQISGILASGSNGIIVNAGANDTVTLRNLSINGFGTGINGVRFLAGGGLTLDAVQIFGFTANGLDVALNQATNTIVNVQNSTFTDNGGKSLNFAQLGIGSLIVTINKIVSSKSGQGLQLGGSANNRLFLTGSTLASSNGIGLHAILGIVAAENNTIASNVIGVQAESGATIRLANNGIYNNGKGINIVAGGTVASDGTNRLGNTLNGSPPNAAIVVQ